MKKLILIMTILLMSTVIYTQDADSDEFYIGLILNMEVDDFGTTYEQVANEFITGLRVNHDIDVLDIDNVILSGKILHNGEEAIVKIAIAIVSADNMFLRSFKINGEGKSDEVYMSFMRAMISSYQLAHDLY